MLLPRMTKAVLHELGTVIAALSTEAYTAPCSFLSGSSIGQHVRHSLEMFQCMIAGYEVGVVNYDHRKRNLVMEGSTEYALEVIKDVMSQLERPDRIMNLEGGLGTDLLFDTTSSYNREMLYNLEHAIHHMALMRVAIEQTTDIALPPSFGVAPSTLQFRAECVR